MSKDGCRQHLSEVLDGTRNPNPREAKSSEERFAEIVRVLSVYEQVYYYAICRVQSRVKAKTAPVSVTMMEYQRLRDTLNLPGAAGRSFWTILAALETYGFVKVHYRSNRIKLLDQGVPLEEILAHLSGLDYAGELACAGA